MADLMAEFDVAVPAVTEPEKVYVGARLHPHPSGGVRPPLVLVQHGEKQYELPITRRHSDHFEWAYEGSGPTELSLCILADHLEVDDVDPMLVLSFKKAVIAQLHPVKWTLAAGEVASFLGLHLRKPS